MKTKIHFTTIEMFNGNYQNYQYNQINAFTYASQGQIPPIQFTHDPNITDNNGKTVQQYLQQHKLPIPNCWYQKMPKHLNSSQIEQAIYNQPIQQSQNWKPHYQNNDGWTVAMILARFNRQIPKEWHHDTYIMNKYGQTVEDILKQQGIEIPKEWKCNQKMKSLKRQFCKENKIGCHFNIKPDLHDNPRQETYAIFLARNGVQLQYIPKYYMAQQSQNIRDIDGKTVFDYLNPNSETQKPKSNKNSKQKQKLPQVKKDMNGYTDAMLEVRNGHNPSQANHHDPSIQNNKGQTVAMMLAEEGKIPPQEWFHSPTQRDNNEMTVAMNLAWKGINPPQQWQHKPELQNKAGKTVAMFLALNGKDVPVSWQHRPDLQNSHGFTVAMYYAQNGMVPPKQWFHHPTITNNKKNTVALLLAQNKTIPPEEWHHDPSLKNEAGYTVQQYLEYHGLEVPDIWKVK